MGPISTFAFAVALAGAPAPVRLTQQDVDATNQKAAAAYSALVSMWSNEFARLGARFDAPDIVRYRGAARSRCGIMSPSNAAYCDRDNTIYFDEIFLAAQGKSAGASLGTDGDMAAVGIIAHEMGHAVAMQLGYDPRSSYEREAVADCLAGAFAKQSDADGYLEKGDLEEAMWGMAAAGDPQIQSTGNPRRDARLSALLARQAHGTRDQRMANFKTGFAGGGKACISDLR